MAEALNLQQQSSKSQAKPMRRDEATTKSLISACYAGDLERVVALLGDGADPTATDVVGWFPLYQAACGGDSHSEDHAKVIATLIDHGVHPDQRTPNGETALMAAAYRGHAPCVAILVMKGADAHTTATDGPWKDRDCFWIAKTSVEQKVIKQDELEVVLAALKLERGAAPPQQAPPPAPAPVEPPKTQEACAYCGDAATRRCSRCKKVWYCSVLCQQEHYRKGHRSKCWAAKGVKAAPLLKPQKPQPPPPVEEDDFSALPPHEAAARAGERAAQKIFDKGGSVEAAATEAGRAASLAAMARGLSIADAAAASREACAAVTGD